jgi:hypothetical protein
MVPGNKDLMYVGMYMYMYLGLFCHRKLTVCLTASPLVLPSRTDFDVTATITESVQIMINMPCIRKSHDLLLLSVLR